jgi:hypothetical protein
MFKVRGTGIRRGFAVASVAAFATVASIGAASATTKQDLVDKKYSCGAVTAGFATCTKTVDGKESEYYCSGEKCEHVKGPFAKRRAQAGPAAVVPGTIGPAK